MTSNGKASPDEVSRVVEHIHDVAAQAREAQTLASDLSRELDATKRQLDFLRSQLAEVQHQKDFYQRHSTSLITRLSDISLLIDQAVQEAKHEAYRPNGAAPAQSAPQGPALEDDVQGVVARIAKMNGEGNGK